MVGDNIFSALELDSLKTETYAEPRPQNTILVPLRVFVFNISYEPPPPRSFKYGRPPTGATLPPRFYYGFQYNHAFYPT